MLWPCVLARAVCHALKATDAVLRVANSRSGDVRLGPAETAQNVLQHVCQPSFLEHRGYALLQSRVSNRLEL